MGKEGVEKKKEEEERQKLDRVIFRQATHQATSFHRRKILLIGLFIWICVTEWQNVLQNVTGTAYEKRNILNICLPYVQIADLPTRPTFCKF